MPRSFMFILLQADRPFIQKLSILQADRPFIQKLFKPYTDEGFETTLEHLLQQSIPDLLKGMSVLYFTLILCILRPNEKIIVFRVTQPYLKGDVH